MVHNSLLQNHHSDILSLPTRIGQAADGHLAPFYRCSSIGKAAGARLPTLNAIFAFCIDAEWHSPNARASYKVYGFEA